ncbi:MAG TPA: CD1871A family CXXC motif-containing protein [Clostridiales bacterium]|nr:CD1871A family CXXC motif-containing protein [Clostridiales bacterium]
MSNLKYFLLVIAAAFLLYGVARGETLVVLKKAAHICLECIGIG